MSERRTRKPPVASGLSRLTRFTGERAAQLLPQTRLAGPMPWVIAIMVSLMVVAAAGGLALNNMASGARAELAGGVTVQFLEANAELREEQASVALSILRDAPGVASVRRVPEDELDALLAPWLGDLASGDDAVPVPALVDVRLDGEAGPRRLDALRAALAGPAPSARVDAQSSWLGPVFTAISSLQWLALALVLLLSLATVAAVWLAARSALGGNRETIEIVHLLGGTDAQIARIFQRSVGFDSAMGGAAGLAAGLAAILVMARQFADLGSGMIAGGGLGAIDWLLIAAVPFLAVGLAMLTARLTVIAALGKML